jgi:hypothetical protein
MLYQWQALVRTTLWKSDTSSREPVVEGHRHIRNPAADAIIETVTIGAIVGAGDRVKVRLDFIKKFKWIKPVN